ncbi:6-phosphofructokinase, partial [Microvirga sp. 3-52]|nr:6-phosphofructokinase [Microvirga sp. 3-52]
ILIPEENFDIDDIVERLASGTGRGKKHSIIIVAEGVMSANELAKILRDTADIDNRYSVLGHVQRGGSPSVRDRVIASQFGARAVEVLLEGHGGKAIGMQKNQVVDY